MAKIIGNPTVTPMAIPDWNQTDPTKADFIKNKPKAIKEINESEIDNLYFSHPDFIEDGIYLVTDDSLEPNYGRNQYILITATNTDRPNNGSTSETGVGSTYQLRLSPHNGDLQTRMAELDINNVVWTQWKKVGSGGGSSADLDAHRNNEDENAKHLTATEIGALQGVVADIESVVETIERVDGDIDSVQSEMLQESERLNRLTDKVYGLEDRVLVLEASPNTEVPTTLEQNKAYEFGTHEALSLSFPSTADNGDVIYVSFLSRDMPTNLTVNTTNTTDFDLIPEVNTGYEIYAKYNVSIGCWVVKYSDYSIEGM